MAIDRNGDTAVFSTGYLDDAWESPSEIIADMREALRGVKYDTIVVSGHSGTLIGPVLARALRKKLLVIRKTEDFESSHASSPWIGQLGNRWVLVDDFISSGRTVVRVVESVLRAVQQTNGRYRVGKWDNEMKFYGSPEPEEPFTTEFVGVYSYSRLSGFKSVDLLDEKMSPREYDKMNSLLNPPSQPEAEPEVKEPEALTISGDGIVAGTFDGVLARLPGSWKELGYMTNDAPAAFDGSKSDDVFYPRRTQTFEQLAAQITTQAACYSSIQLPEVNFKITESGV